ncbi:hypothetical protein [Paenibacillus naphthalenovorans]|uniref:hypothetical protein n=1 Tax=Paenibacillus naphthalenovorans TaxID=162209 RepID=UPI0008875A3C|nr:hypothetical protein [Paenibacillus naphthalenovorans]SDJ79507.1 hypothetical protein SAMN05421868_1452 [Paenibacillus naphthalenovorans]
MVKRELLYADDMIALLSDHPVSIKAIDHFLSLYSSKSQYRSAIHDLLFNETEKLDVTKLTYDDYKRHLPETQDEFNTQQSYKNRFFQFLYAMDYLEDVTGFNTDIHMHKAKLIKEFSKEIEKNLTRVRKSKRSLLQQEKYS